MIYIYKDKSYLLLVNLLLVLRVSVMDAAAKSSSGQAAVDQLQVAPFVVKTYQMVSDPRTDPLIRWGRENNSFLVSDPADFSLLLLPAYFKHSNFSSFVRQLNTYGFKKVDSDRWEFAHESFLRGQTHLLPFIIRPRKKMDYDRGDRKLHIEEDDDDDEMLLKEVGRLRKEQRALEEELEGMNKRLRVTEQRPHQMMSFLIKVAKDPDFLPQLRLLKKQRLVNDQEKRRRLSDSTTHSLRPLPQSFEMDYPSESENFTLVDDDDRNLRGDDQIGLENQVVLLPEFEFGASEETNKVAYPFSLLGHVFF